MSNVFLTPHQVKVDQSTNITQFSNNVKMIIDIVESMPKTLVFDSNRKKTDWKVGTTKKNLQKLSDLHSVNMNILMELNRYISVENEKENYKIAKSLLGITDILCKSDIDITNSIVYTMMNIGQYERDTTDNTLNLTRKVEPISTTYSSLLPFLTDLMANHTEDVVSAISPKQKLFGIYLGVGIIIGVLTSSLIWWLV